MAYFNPVRVHFGGSDFKALPGILGNRASVVISTPGTRKRAALRDLEQVCSSSIRGIFSDVAPNPTLSSVEQGLVVIAPWKPEVLIALGGGSTIDFAKAIAASLAEGAGPGWISAHLLEKRPFPTAFKPIPIIAIPTTSGTGSEVTPWGTLWNEKTGAKHSISHPSLFPEAALLIPELTLSQSHELSLFTALDALSHSMEAIWNRGSNPVSDVFAEAALARIVTNLETVLADPASLSARRELQQASLMAGFAISSCATALAHSISYPLTGKYGMPHGLACSFTLPSLLRFNSVTGGSRMEPIIRAFGASDPENAVQVLEALFERLDVKAHARRYVDRDRAKAVGDLLLAPGRADNNIRPATCEDALRILLDSIS